MRDGIFHPIFQYAKVNNESTKNNTMEKVKFLSLLICLDAINSYGQVQKLPIDMFQWVKNIYASTKHFDKVYNEYRL